MKFFTLATTLTLALTHTVNAAAGSPREVVASGVFSSILRPPYNAVLVANYSIATTDTQASVFRQDNVSEIIVAFPGSASAQDFLTDFTLVLAIYPGCPLCFVHAGFLTAFNSIAPSLNATLTDQVKKYPNYNITITGGSLGGALGKLAFVYLKSQPAFKAKVTQGWSFGEPRVGNGPFADYTDSLSGASDDTNGVGIYRRVTHQNDVVPQIPPTSVGYKHSRTEIWEMNNAQGVPDAAHTYRCYGQEPSDCVNGQNSFDANAHLTYAGANVTTCS